MTVKDILNSTPISFSFEFFPPRTDDGWDNLFHSIADLMPLKPAWVSVTYGAGGSTRDRTHDLVMRIQKETNLTAVAHLTCVGSSQDEISGILDRYVKNDVLNILALGGDPPKDMPDWRLQPDGFRYAGDLVRFIKRQHPAISVGVAGFPEGHPATPNRLLEIDHLKAKVDAGADYIITQLFFDNRDFYDFCERCEIAGIHVPILAGIMPILTKKGMYRMVELAAGARLPARLLKLISRADSDDYVAKAGVHWASEQVRDLLDNDVRGIHFFTLNKSKATIQIYESLGVRSSEQFLL
ncbi:methylenetetrahydrofolate reductase [NAD(P)H] [candidate division KSB1 bacterium]|nr:methylenetetrahydrofolate reductase [NAD(P)H] [candidate division KSB1 bacterium]RQW11488.1 MAG: methylenetetrahydrofolate reductase [NAD(P)H] [candidate division KSB1 bacterium]